MINWRFELGGGDPLGDLEFVGQGASLRVSNTYADAWFDSLLDGLTRLKAGARQVSLDLVDEPCPLRLTLQGDALVLEYRESKLILGPFDEAVRLIVEDANRYLPMLQSLSSESPTLFESIRRRLEALS